MTDYNTNFSHNIRDLRQIHKLTQVQMAEILGISISTLRRIEENAATRINSGMLCRVCDRFGLSVDAILLEKWPK